MRSQSVRAGRSRFGLSVREGEETRKPPPDPGTSPRPALSVITRIATITESAEVAWTRRRGRRSPCRRGYSSQQEPARAEAASSEAPRGQRSLQITAPSIGHSTVPGQSGRGSPSSGQRSRQIVSPVIGHSMSPGQSLRFAGAAAAGTQARALPASKRPIAAAVQAHVLFGFFMIAFSGRDSPFDCREAVRDVPRTYLPAPEDESALGARFPGLLFFSRPAAPLALARPAVTLPGTSSATEPDGPVRSFACVAERGRREDSFPRLEGCAWAGEAKRSRVRHPGREGRFGRFLGVTGFGRTWAAGSPF